jgi:intracellular sulfur oxidation DsrE/DsrF family protein
MRLKTVSPVGRRIIIALVVILVVAAAAILLFVTQVKAAPEQPIAFNHQAMVQMGVQCLYCHNTARESPAAGMPSMAKCMGCHKVIDPTVPVIKEVSGYWDRQQPIPWVRVNVMPRFVFFSHEAHINNGVNCETCHGDVGHMTVAKPVVKMNMGWCLDCHEKQPNAPQLMDCVICHR